MLDEAPPPVGVARPTRPPAQLGTFVGRDAELRELTALLAAGERLVTLVGPPGIGKTRLVARWVEGGAGGFDPGAVAFCDLTEAASTDSVAAVVANAIDAPPPSRRADDSVAWLARALSQRGPTLLVLDNGEQVTSHVAALAGRWLAAAADLRIVMTSRRRLGMTGEFVFEVPPLSVPPRGDHGGDAIALLLDRIRRVRRDFAPTEADLAALAEIARQLDGIPLALELCAARANLVAPQELLSRLARRFELLDRRTTDREATLRGAIDWSWSLLGPAEQRALAECSVFRGGFDLEAAEAVLTPSDFGVLEVLHSLRDSSLLIARPSAADLRLGLYLSIREYAAERLEASSGADATRLRHARYFADAAERWAARAETADGRADLARLSSERDNLVTAAQWALARKPRPVGARELALHCLVALRPVVMMRSFFQDELAALTDAMAPGASLEDGPPERPRLLANAFFMRGMLRTLQGAHHAADQDLGRACDLAIAGHEAKLAVSVLTAQATLHLDEGRIESARTKIATARSLLRDATDPRMEGWTLITLAFCDIQTADSASARAHALGAMELFEPSGGVRERAVARLTLGIVEQGDGRLDDAAAWCEKAAAAAKSGGGRLYEHSALVCLGIVRQEQGRLEEAVRLLADAAAALIGLDDRFRGLALAHLGGTLALVDRIDEAEKRLAEAERVFAQMQTELRIVCPLARGLLELALAERARASGDRVLAAELRRKAQSRADAVRAPSVSGTPSVAAWSVDARVALRILERALGELGQGEALLLHPEGDWFEPPGGGRVDCRKLKNVRRVLAALVARRRDAPGRAMTPAALLSAGWPGERIVAGAARNRLHVAISTLRRLGLRDLLVATEDGYLLDPAVPTRIVPLG